MHSITVVNVKVSPCDFYVGRGRGSALGNPFTVAEHGRDRCIALYRVWLAERIAARDPAVCAALNRIYFTALQRPITLGCWCAPLACHASVVAETARAAWVARSG